MRFYFLHHHLLPLLLLPSLTTSSKILIDSNGIINRSAPSTPTPSNGILTILTNPSTTTFFPSPEDGEGLTVDDSDDTLVLTTTGATLKSSATNIISQGKSASAAAGVSGSVVLAGITSDDAADFMNTRHGRTLSSVFGTRLLREGKEKTLLVLAVEGGGGFEESEVVRDVEELFDACVLGLGDKVVEKGVGELEDLYEVQVVSVENEGDVDKILAMAKAAASRSPLLPTTPILPSITQILSTPIPTYHTDDPPTIATSIITSQDAFARQSKSSRAKLTSWKNRVQRGLLIESFGKQATALRQRCLEQYDKDTISCSGTNAAKYRLDLRRQLKESIEKTLAELFARQVTIAEKSTLQNFNKILLRQKPGPDVTSTYDKNAAAVRAAAFAFDTSLSDLEIPSLGLTKTEHCTAITSQLNAALLSFPDSNAAQARDLKTTKAKAAKQKTPSEKSIDVGFNLVAMVRPDGFGNLQGFAGYSLGNHGITVGVHNDADAPETISQFGGVRPPFLRVQPKLNFDVEL
eukprot:CAMPEP_0172513292 /NCGR_PEP_ID=MMETSP1066-20121228/251469_1 /TAXON_ID=671091 /ORGANISM="Coscinodiscus wailesii, Strain CCMP2513" /LENGTH=520 /DNA_ID=CAMNT_0013293495 /DNA_START=50 /DNA_END=1612 /DNA_ORIENTATION=+